MPEEYSLKFFLNHYLEHRCISEEKKNETTEAFMGGAHTVMLMMTKALQNDDKALIRQLTQELSEYMTIKRAEAEFTKATIQ